MSYIWVESPVERITRHSDNAEKRPGAGPAQEDSSRDPAAHGSCSARSNYSGRIAISDSDNNRPQVFGAQPRFIGNLCEKFGTNFFARSCESTILALPSQRPSDSDQCGQESLRLRRGPTAHATEKTLSNCGGTSSP